MPVCLCIYSSVFQCCKSDKKLEQFCIGMQGPKKHWNWYNEKIQDDKNKQKTWKQSKVCMIGIKHRLWCASWNKTSIRCIFFSNGNKAIHVIMREMLAIVKN